jgi:mRNA interferase MazF
MEISKYFLWYKLKNKIQKRKRALFNEREVWWCFWGLNIGNEQNGGKDFARPVVILKKFNKNLFIAVPLTEQNKKGKYYVFLQSLSRVAIISQNKTLDSKRLYQKIGFLSKDDFVILQNRTRNLYF